MTGKGWVTTARGQALNMDDLKMQAERPIGFKDAKSEVKPKKLPKRIPINVRGFLPAQGEAKVPEMPEKVAGVIEARKGKKTARVSVRPAQAESLADITRIKVDKAKFIKEAPKDGARAASEDVLANIMDDLNQDAPKLQKAAETEESVSKKAPKKTSKKK